MSQETVIQSQEQQTENFKVKGLTKNQAELLKKAELPLLFLGGILAGVSVQSIFANANYTPLEEDAINPHTGDDTTKDPFSENESGSIAPGEEDRDEPVYEFEAPCTIAFSNAVTDDMSFGQAFAAARRDLGPGGFFNWRGASYHTLNKEEWDSLSDQEKADYLEQIQNNINFEQGEYNKVVPDNNEEENNSNDDDSDSDSDNNEDDDQFNNDDANESDLDEIIPEEDLEWAELDEIIAEDDLIEDLNNEDAASESDGIAGGLDGNSNSDNSSKNSNDDLIDDLNDDQNNINYDSDFGNDLVQGQDGLDNLDLDL